MKGCITMETIYISMLVLAISLVSSLPLDMDEQDFSVEEKRGGFRAVPFPCNGYDSLPRCLNGGKGPRKTWTKTGRFCVCLCPTKWIGPECSYAAETLEAYGN